MNTYNDTIAFWDNIFSKQEARKHIKSLKVNRDLEDAICWLSNESKTILDYGCGSGTMLFKCADYENVCMCVGIDISQKAVELGRRTALLNNLEGKVQFSCGGIKSLEKKEYKEIFFEEFRQYNRIFLLVNNK